MRLVSLMIVAAIFIIAAMFISTNLLQVVTVEDPDLLIDPQDVRGMVVVHRGVPYTLNFSQQKSMMSMLNQMQEIGEPEEYKSGKALPFDQLIIYHFDTPDDIVRGKGLEGDWNVLTFDTGDYRRFLSNRPRREFMPVLKQAYAP
ncbi:MAG: hypothetical protein K940chlam3_00300 [Chlamydiae bacterium]|nr:hypothetical protein [Chlamydiota bacterium]